MTFTPKTHSLSLSPLRSLPLPLALSRPPPRALPLPLREAGRVAGCVCVSMSEGECVFVGVLTGECGGVSESECVWACLRVCLVGRVRGCVCVGVS